MRNGHYLFYDGSDDVFTGGMKGEHFHLFLDYLYQKCDTISLDYACLSQGSVVPRFLGENHWDFYQKMRTYELPAIYVRDWFANCYTRDRDDMDYNFDGYFKVCLFKFNKKVLDLLKLYLTDGLFMFKKQGTSDVFPLENLCFFRNKNLFLGTLSHEFIAKSFPDTKDELIELEKAVPHPFKWMPMDIERITDKDYLKLG